MSAQENAVNIASTARAEFRQRRTCTNRAAAAHAVTGSSHTATTQFKAWRLAQSAHTQHHLSQCNIRVKEWNG